MKFSLGFIILPFKNFLRLGNRRNSRRVWCHLEVKFVQTSACDKMLNTQMHGIAHYFSSYRTSSPGSLSPIALKIGVWSSLFPGSLSSIKMISFNPRKTNGVKCPCLMAFNLHDTTAWDPLWSQMCNDEPKFLT